MALDGIKSLEDIFNTSLPPWEREVNPPDPIRTRAAMREAERLLKLYAQRKYGKPEHVAIKAVFLQDLLKALRGVKK